MIIIVNKTPTLLNDTQKQLLALAMYHAIFKNDTSMLERFKQELINVWCGEGI